MSEQNEVFRRFLPRMFFRDNWRNRRKLDENWPNLVVNPLCANSLWVFHSLAYNGFTTKFGQFSSNLRPITPVIISTVLWLIDQHTCRIWIHNTVRAQLLVRVRLHGCNNFTSIAEMKSYLKNCLIPGLIKAGVTHARCRWRNIFFLQCIHQHGAQKGQIKSGNCISYVTYVTHY